jgi:hypothetical protein
LYIIQLAPSQIAFRVVSIVLLFAACGVRAEDAPTQSKARSDTDEDVRGTAAVLRLVTAIHKHEGDSDSAFAASCEASIAPGGVEYKRIPEGWFYLAEMKATIAKDVNRTRVILSIDSGKGDIDSVWKAVSKETTTLIAIPPTSGGEINDCVRAMAIDKEKGNVVFEEERVYIGKGGWVSVKITVTGGGDVSNEEMVEELGRQYGGFLSHCKDVRRLSKTLE